MKRYSFRIRILVLIGVLFLSISSVYAETAEEYVRSGRIHGLRGNFTQAISDFTKAIEINPNYADAYYFRAVLYNKLKDYDKAWQDVHKAEDLGYKFDFQLLEDLKKASGRDK